MTKEEKELRACYHWTEWERKAKELENKIADIKANCDLAIEGRDIKIMELEQQIEKMKRHCNCKHRDSEGYCEVKRTYLIDISYDGCDKWELED